MTSKTTNQSNVTNAKRAFNRATNLAQLGYECLTYSETLFAAIQNAKTLDQAKAIAKVGHCLSQDHAGMFDFDHEQLTKEGEALS